ncbi:hypothetical protein [Hyphococcus sp.]|uniref:hypothetical protein n=1 Tax=Hyphococcus sp. TaxID=2038636 RepID=UPI003D0E0744
MFFKKSKVDDQLSFVQPEAVRRVGKEHARETVQGWAVFDPKKILYDGKEGGYSIAIGIVDGERTVCAIRWNGEIYDEVDEGGFAHTGTPKQEAFATWFVLPDFLYESAVKATYSHLESEALRLFAAEA